MSFSNWYYFANFDYMNNLLQMILNLICCLIFRQLRTYGMLNRIVDPSYNLCIVCFLNIYQNRIPLLGILEYHISFTNIFSHLFTLKEISHFITPIWIILSIQSHTHKLKWIISFSSHNQQTKKTIMQKQRKIKIPNYRNWTDVAETKQIFSRSYTITPKQKIAET
jgi:hypothetical protein